jgi:iron complex transport system substrate-binding protein
MEPFILRSPPKRVISLVPSITESLFDLGIDDCLIGITDYCVFPQEKVALLPKVGGVINPRVDEIISLNPDLVLADQEENSKNTVDTLRAAGITVYVFFPKTIKESLEDLWKLAHIFRSDEALKRLEVLEKTLEWSLLSVQTQKPKRYFCPVWYEKDKSGRSLWMTFNDDTYAGNLLACLGGENIFADWVKDSFPTINQSENDISWKETRYPQVAGEEIIERKPKIILLPSEPYDFTKSSLEQELISNPALEDIQCIRVDGSLIFWHGTRIAKAVTQLGSVFSN